jgi:hypothetical protein
MTKGAYLNKLLHSFLTLTFCIVLLYIPITTLATLQFAFSQFAHTHTNKHTHTYWTMRNVRAGTSYYMPDKKDQPTDLTI